MNQIEGSGGGHRPIGMGVFAVRVIASQELVGVFWGEMFLDVAYCVDEFRDPESCEYLLLSAGDR